MFPIPALAVGPGLRLAGFALAGLVLVAGGFWSGHRVASAAGQREIDTMRTELASAKMDAAQNRRAIESIRVESEQRARIAQEAIRQAGEYRDKANKAKTRLQQISLPADECLALRLVVDVHRGLQP